MSAKIPEVENVFTQLEASLCLLSRAKGEEPPKLYFQPTTFEFQHLHLDGGVYEVTIKRVKVEPETK